MLPQALVGAAKKEKMPALALTDRNNMYGAVHFYEHAQFDTTYEAHLSIPDNVV